MTVKKFLSQKSQIHLKFNPFCLYDAIREACIFCSKAGLENVAVENDNFSVVGWCNGNPLDRSAWDCRAVVQDIRTFLWSYNAFLSFIPREANKAVNYLTRFVLRSSRVPSFYSLPFGVKQRLVLFVCQLYWLYFIPKK